MVAHMSEDPPDTQHYLCTLILKPTQPTHLLPTALTVS